MKTKQKSWSSSSESYSSDSGSSSSDSESEKKKEKNPKILKKESSAKKKSPKKESPEISPSKGVGDNKGERRYMCKAPAKPATEPTPKQSQSSTCALI